MLNYFLSIFYGSSCLFETHFGRTSHLHSMGVNFLTSSLWVRTCNISIFFVDFIFYFSIPHVSICYILIENRINFSKLALKRVKTSFINRMTNKEQIEGAIFIRELFNKISYFLFTFFFFVFT